MKAREPTDERLMLNIDVRKARPAQEPPAEPTPREMVAEWIRRALDPEDRLQDFYFNLLRQK